MALSYISFGANLAEPNKNLSSTLTNVSARLAEFKEISAIRISRGFRTPAFPIGGGPDFLNAAIKCETTFDAPRLLDVLHQIEADLGRIRAERWGPRHCDLDLLGHGNNVLPDRLSVEDWMGLSDEEAISRLPDQLILPHPRFHRRAFVLVPLADVAPDWRHPILGRTVAEMAADLTPAERAEIVPIET